MQMARRHALAFVALSFMAAVSTAAIAAPSFQDDTLTPLRAAIRKQANRLSSADAEERRDAIMRLGLMRHADASRAAISGLKDSEIAVRVAAASAVLSLPANESAGVLIPLLSDKNEFVRQETAYALGRTGSQIGVAPLIDLLTREKLSGVRGAAIVSLGLLRDEAAVVPLAKILGSAGGKKGEKNVFVLRATAVALGEIRNRAAVPTLITALENVKNEPDVRREAARSLGLIGDPTAMPALRAALASDDPYLSLAAEKSLQRIAAR
jgi:HEAT repeat protein